jgi:hypothetical protein
MSKILNLMFGNTSKLNEDSSVYDQKLLDEAFIDAAKKNDIDKMTSLVSIKHPDKFDDDILIKALNLAVQSNNIEAVSYLIGVHDVDISANYNICLKLTIRCNYKKMFILLFENNAYTKAYELHQKFKLPDHPFYKTVNLLYNSLINECMEIACEYGAMSIIKYLFNKNVNVNEYDGIYLKTAVLNGHLNVVKSLYSHGADVSLNDNIAIKEACRLGNLAIVQFLHIKGAKLDANSNEPMRNALYMQHTHIISYLIEHGVDVKYDIILLEEVIRGHRYDILKILYDLGVDFSLNDYKSLKCAIEECNLDMIRYIITRINVANAYMKFIGIAIRTKDLEVVKYIIGYYSSIGIKNDIILADYVVTAAAANGTVDILQYILDKGGNPRANNDGPIKTAALNGKYESVVLLHQNGADLTNCDYFAFRRAAQRGFTDIINYIYNNGGACADLAYQYIIINEYKETKDALYKMVLKDHNQIIMLLKYAAVYNDLNILKRLRNDGISLSSGDCISFHTAFDMKRTHIMKYLHDNGGTVHVDFVNILKKAALIDQSLHDFIVSLI